MTASKQSIISDMKKYCQGRKGKLIACFEDEPIPKHNRNDILIMFEAGDQEVL